MADKDNAHPDNAPGKYYVDDSCIDCDVCRQTAPDNFGHNEDEGYAMVVKQPETPDEEDLCQQAMESCPVEAIGDDG